MQLPILMYRVCLASENNKVVPGAEMLVLKDGKIVLKKRTAYSRHLTGLPGKECFLKILCRWRQIP